MPPVAPSVGGPPQPIGLELTRQNAETTGTQRERKKERKREAYNEQSISINFIIRRIELEECDARPVPALPHDESSKSQI